ncbi:mitochondrial distribution and morphology [Entomophthora muscae]|uniref:Mitochondrial distribution and morphology n=1 Tax=Entomophthora muscae TaxID=34485 RepID=A0ACC2USD8_9FUNG|nr:mitochondrial distribution and morphology [Entomophthora muscae]
MELDKKIWAVYDLLEKDRYDLGLEKIEPLIKQYPNHPFLVSLKAYILLKCGRQEEAVRTAFRAKTLEPIDIGSLQNLSAVFRSAGKASEALELFERAFQRSPSNDELGQKYMHLLIKEHQFKTLQAVALKMHRQSKSPQHWFWVIMCLVLQAESLRLQDPIAFQKDISYTLAERYLLKASDDKLIKGFEELYLFYLVYMGQGKEQEALKLLDGPLAQINRIAPKVRDLRLGLLEKMGCYARVKDIAAQIIEEDIDNWIAYLAYTNAVVAMLKDNPDSSEGLVEARMFLKTLSLKSSGLAAPKRGPFLAEVELAAKCKDSVLPLTIAYLDRFGSKACAFEDLLPYLNYLAYESSDKSDLMKLKEHIEELIKSTEIKGLAQKDAIRNTAVLSNLFKIERFLALSNPRDKATHLMGLYQQALPLGNSLEKTEKQYSDDFALLAAHYLLDAPGENALQAALILEYAVSHSQHNFHLKFLLVRAYHLLGAYQRPFDIYSSLDVKHIQLDTLSHLVVDTGASLGHYSQTYSACHSSRAIYLKNRAEVPEMIAKAFQYNTFSKIQEFIKFQARLENSLQRRVTDLELLRSEMLPSSSSLEAWLNLLDSVPEAALSVSPDKLSDNRDFDVLLSFTPSHMPQHSVDRKTELLSRRSANWVLLTAHKFKMLKAVSRSDCTPADITALLEDFVSITKLEEQCPVEAQFISVVPRLLKLALFINDGTSQQIDHVDSIATTFQNVVKLLEDQILDGCSGPLLRDLAACIESLSYVSIFCRLLLSSFKPTMLAESERSSQVNDIWSRH